MCKRNTRRRKWMGIINVNDQFSAAFRVPIMFPNSNNMFRIGGRSPEWRKIARSQADLVANAQHHRVTPVVLPHSMNPGQPVGPRPSSVPRTVEFPLEFQWLWGPTVGGCDWVEDNFR